MLLEVSFRTAPFAVAVLLLTPVGCSDDASRSGESEPATGGVDTEVGTDDMPTLDPPATDTTSDSDTDTDTDTDTATEPPADCDCYVSDQTTTTTARWSNSGSYRHVLPETHGRRVA